MSSSRPKFHFQIPVSNSISKSQSLSQSQSRFSIPFLRLGDGEMSSDFLKFPDFFWIFQSRNPETTGTAGIWDWDRDWNLGLGLGLRLGFGFWNGDYTGLGLGKAGIPALVNMNHDDKNGKDNKYLSYRSILLGNFKFLNF